MLTLYGIKNCDTVKKAQSWLKNNQVEFQFHDFRQDGLEQGQLRVWVDAVGWEALLNKRSTTWRQLAEADKAPMDTNKAIKLMLAQPTLIKRPVITRGDTVIVGFKEQDLQGLTN